MPEGKFRGVGMSAYDPKTGEWAIFKGKPIRVRVIWSQITPTSAHWEQAFSPDGGKTWETNWITDFRRVP